MDNSYIKGPRQIRAILCLLEGPISVKDLGPKIGALNQRQVIMELRNQGLKEVIRTKKNRVIDRDGRVCCPGEYYVPEEFKPLLQELLMKDMSMSFHEPKTNGENK